MLNPLKERISSWAAKHQSPKEEKAELLQRKRIQELPLLRAAKENDIQRLKKLLEDETCDPFQRGAVGETALHVAVQYENLEAAEILLDEAPELINQPMTSDVYKGQTALHIATVNQNGNLVVELIRRGADVSSPRATGKFFALSKKNLFYFGEHILTFAACVMDIEIVKILLDHGADLHATDFWGNSVLHILVLQPNKSLSCQMFDYLLSQDGGKTLIHSQNRRGLTPLQLAAFEGNVVMFQHLIQKKRKIQSTYGPPVTTMMYDMSEIDSWEDQPSVLEIIASSNKSQAHKILNISPVKELLENKWNSIGRPYTWFLALVYVLYMICFSLCCANRPLMPREENITDLRDITLYVKKPLKESYLTYSDHLRLVGEVISVIGALILLLSELSDISRNGLKYFISHTFWRNQFSIIKISYSCLILVILVLRLTDSEEIYPMAVALVLGWCYTMYFAHGFQMLGPFTIIIRKMAASDLLKFCWLMAVVVCGYSLAFYVSFQTVDQQAFGAFSPYIMSLISTYWLFCNILNGPANYTVDSPVMYSPIYGSFYTLAFLLMFNLLIAMMGDTQGAMTKKKEELWKAEISGATVKMEQIFPKCLRFGSKSDEQDLEERQYICVEERKWHSYHLYEVSGSSSDDESDEDMPSQKSQERNPGLDPQEAIRTVTVDGTEDRANVDQNDNAVWQADI
ncbi:transient receptor potential cation channel subfamily V member 6-like [Bufo gargarizans]|uniref:transient receptor potential cation channel subfamily V member 6-like n=1 Tax=Bufo gargarizans TaxID=30331 RepID=UPI001CF1971C|nr:transient receptor potential cation channel subfamily V member 6-like [Bufo gargarizans]